MIWRCCFLVYFALSAVCRAGQTAPVQAQTPRHAVKGIVTNAVSGEPLNRALVQLNGASMLTGLDGRFEFNDVPEGPANFALQKPGFFDPRGMSGSPWSQPAQPMAIGSGANDFQLKLIPAAKIAGRVTDENDEPVDEVQIEVLSEQIINGYRHWLPRGGSATDDDGSYRAGELPPGHYIVRATGHLMSAPIGQSPIPVTPPTYYPAERELRSAQAIDLQPGQEFRADFRLRPEEGFRVSGKVAGLPASANLTIRLLDSNGQDAISELVRFDQSRGGFSMPAVPHGTWRLSANGNDSQGRGYQAEQEITVADADLRDLQLALRPAASIPVIVHHVTEEPQESGASTLHMTITSMDAYGVRAYDMMPVQGGGFSFSNVSEGKYRLRVQSFGKECLESAWYGRTDILHEFLTVGAEAGTQPLTVNMTSACASFNATVSPGQDAVGVLVIAPESASLEPELVPVAAASAPGESVEVSSELLKFSPGTYQVYGFASADGLEYTNPEVLREYPGQSVEFTAGRPAEFSIKLSQLKSN